MAAQLLATGLPAPGPPSSARPPVRLQSQTSAPPTRELIRWLSLTGPVPIILQNMSPTPLPSFLEGRSSYTRKDFHSWVRFRPRSRFPILAGGSPAPPPPFPTV